jgi:hypothetical protein
MEATVPLIFIFAQQAPANAPEPPNLRLEASHSSAARAMRILRDFAALHALPAADQRDIWRFNADLIRASRNPISVPSRSWPTDGDAA